MIRTQAPSQPQARLRLEPLEQREVPAILFGVTAANRLVTFDSTNPTVLLSNLPISGMASPGEKIMDIDVLPGSGGLYGRSNLGRLYLINTLSGFGLQIGTAVPLSTPNVGTDFNPLTSQLQVESNVGENISINPFTGSVSSINSPLTYVPGDVSQGLAPRVSAIAFTNSAPFAPSTTLFGIDNARNTLVEFVGNPNNGQLLTIGSIGVDVKANNLGFDIDSTGNVAYASIQVPGAAFSLFAQINLANGAASFISGIGPDRLITDIAVARFTTTTTTPTPTTTTTTGIATPFFSPSASTMAIGPGISTPFFSTLTPVTPIGVPTSPLGPGSVQPLAAGTFAPLFGTTSTAFFTPITSLVASTPVDTQTGFFGTSTTLSPLPATVIM